MYYEVVVGQHTNGNLKETKMLFKYRIQHEGQKENIGFVVAATSEEIINVANENFPGWDVDSWVSVQVVKEYKKLPEVQVEYDLSWVHPTFAKI